MYLLYHSYEYGNNNQYEEIKFLGIYSSEMKAEEAIERYYKLDGFRKYPKECFEIENFKIDTDSAWKDGFVSSDEIEQDFEVLTSCFNEQLHINNIPQDSWNDEKYYNALCDVNTKVYNTDNVAELSVKESRGQPINGALKQAVINDNF